MKKQRVEERRQRTGTLLVIGGVAILCACSPLVLADTSQDLNQKIKPRGTSFYRDFFDSIVYNGFASWLRFDNLANRASFKRIRALDVNVFDEVPDSNFFVNRHGRKPLSDQELTRGPSTGSGPDPKGPWRVTKGKVEGVSTGLFIEDAAGAGYLLKFDPKNNPEMATAAEIISHKLFHAFGYHIPEYYLVRFSPDILTIDPGATYYDEDGFNQPLTAEALATLLERIPKFKGGVLRASASKLLPASRKGYMDFEGRRTDDPDDLIPHEDRRSIRALRVFASWLNHYDLRKGNTMDVVVTEEDGRPYLKHYLIDFGSTLGSAANRPKVPTAGYEHIVDWYEIGEEIPTFKLREKAWERNWDRLNRQVQVPEIGYFDNFQFDPGQWKTQLPHEAFRRLTRGDAFWAAKILTSFTDGQIRSIVETAEYSNPEISKMMLDLLTARRNLIGQYWFARVTPLDRIKLSRRTSGEYEIQFTDLALQYGFAKPEETRYRFRWIDGSGRQLGGQEFSEPSFSFTLPSQSAGRAVLEIEARRGSSGAWTTPPLRVTLSRQGPEDLLTIAEINHGV